MPAATSKLFRPSEWPFRSSRRLARAGALVLRRKTTARGVDPAPLGLRRSTPRAGRLPPVLTCLEDGDGLRVLADRERACVLTQTRRPRPAHEHGARPPRPAAAPRSGPAGGHVAGTTAFDAPRLCVQIGRLPAPLDLAVTAPETSTLRGRPCCTEAAHEESAVESDRTKFLSMAMVRTQRPLARPLLNGSQPMPNVVAAPASSAAGHRHRRAGIEEADDEPARRRTFHAAGGDRARPVQAPRATPARTVRRPTPPRRRSSPCTGLRPGTRPGSSPEIRMHGRVRAWSELWGLRRASGVALNVSVVPIGTGPQTHRADWSAYDLVRAGIGRRAAGRP